MGVKAKSADEALKTGAIDTQVSRGVAWFLIGGFVLVVAGVPLVQGVVEWARGGRSQALDVFGQAPTRAGLHAWEEDLEKASVVKNALQPTLQEWLSGPGGFGNTSVVVGRDGWLFYRPGVEYLGGPGILDATRLDQRRRQRIDSGGPNVEPDPRKAIVAFHHQCARAGAHLIVMPVPDKAMLQPAQLTARLAFSEPAAPPNNTDFGRLVDELRAGGVDVFDCTPAKIRPDDRLFFTQDTHWTPQWMGRVAGDLAAYVKEKADLRSGQGPALRVEAAEATRVGDLVDLLNLPERQRLFPPQRVDLERVVEADSGRPWQPSSHADLLVLGDSFANIYSQELMGWGDSAGFVEHLALALNRPIDRLVRNDAGAHATRQMLAAQLARGKDRLAGKKVVVWEFAVRELTAGDWKAVEMKAAPPAPARFLTPAPGTERKITGVVEAVAAPPRPGAVPYKDHIVAVHLTDLEDAGGPIPGGQALVYMWSMRDKVLTPAARYRPEQRITLTLRPWSDVADRFDSVNRRDLDDEAVMLEEPCWGEEVKP